MREESWWSLTKEGNKDGLDKENQKGRKVDQENVKEESWWWKNKRWSVENLTKEIQKKNRKPKTREYWGRENKNKEEEGW